MANVSDKYSQIMQQGQQAADAAYNNAQQGQIASQAALQKQKIGNENLQKLLGLKTLPVGAGASLDGASITRGFNPATLALQQNKALSAEAGKVEAGKKSGLGKMEEGLQMAENAKQFLNDPNSYNIQELKVLVPMMQGWPARAMGTESKASGFDPKGWNSAIQAVSKYSDDPQNNPLTANTLSTLRNNFKTVYGNATTRYKAARDNFWSSTAPNLAPTLDSTGRLDQMHQAHEGMVKAQYGDMSLPWEKPGQAAPAPTPPPEQSWGSMLKQGIGSLLGHPQTPGAAPAAPIAPAQTKMGKDGKTYAKNPQSGLWETQ